MELLQYLIDFYYVKYCIKHSYLGVESSQRFTVAERPLWVENALSASGHCRSVYSTFRTFRELC